MDFDTYRNLSAVNWSSLKFLRPGLPKCSPKHYQHALANPKPDTPAMALGRAIHCAVLEPDEFPRRYVVVSDAWLDSPRLNRGRKEGKAFRAELIEKHPEVAMIEDSDAYKRAVFALEHAGQEVIASDDYDRCLAIRDAVRSHPDAGPLVTGPGDNEHTITWTDARTGIECKARLDRVSDMPRMLVDLKSAREIDSRMFGASAHRLGYAGQLAWYRDGYEVAVGIALPCVIVAVEQDAPHDVAVFDVPDDVLAVGREQYRACLDLLAVCRESGEWPGRYPERTVLELPVWALDDNDDWTVTESEAA